MGHNYSDQMDDMDASVFSGEILFTDLDEFKYYLERWQKAVNLHETNIEIDDNLINITNMMD